MDRKAASLGEGFRNQQKARTGAKGFGYALHEIFGATDDPDGAVSVFAGAGQLRDRNRSWVRRWSAGLLLWIL
jgi:hypothetical protein